MTFTYLRKLVATTTVRADHVGSKAQGFFVWDGGRDRLGVRLTYKLIQDGGQWDLLAIEMTTDIRRHEVTLNKNSDEFYPAWVARAWHTADLAVLDILNDYGATPDSCEQD